MTAVGDLEFRPQRRVIALFRECLDYEYLGDWRDREGNRNIEPGLLEPRLARQGHSPVLIAKVLREFEKAATLGGGRSLFEANREALCLIRYGARVKPEVEENAATVRLIDWEDPAANHFAIAEEVTVAAVTPSGPNWCSTSTALPSA